MPPQPSGQAYRHDFWDKTPSRLSKKDAFSLCVRDVGGGESAPEIRHAIDTGEIVENNIDHRLIKPKHPWTNGQIERMNRTLKDATVKTLPLRDK